MQSVHAMRHEFHPRSCQFTGGGVALLYASKGLTEVLDRAENFDQKIGVQILQVRDLPHMRSRASQARCDFHDDFTHGVLWPHESVSMVCFMQLRCSAVQTPLLFDLKRRS